MPFICQCATQRKRTKSVCLVYESEAVQSTTRKVQQTQADKDRYKSDTKCGRIRHGRHFLTYGIHGAVALGSGNSIEAVALGSGNSNDAVAPGSRIAVDLFEAFRLFCDTAIAVFLGPRVYLSGPTNAKPICNKVAFERIRFIEIDVMTPAIRDELSMHLITSDASQIVLEFFIPTFNFVFVSLVGVAAVDNGHRVFHHRHTRRRRNSRDSGQRFWYSWCGRQRRSGGCGGRHWYLEWSWTVRNQLIAGG